MGSWESREGKVMLAQACTPNATSQLLSQTHDVFLVKWGYGKKTTYQGYYGYRVVLTAVSSWSCSRRI